MQTVMALTHFPPGLLPLIASFLGTDSILVVGGVDRYSTVMATSFCHSISTNSWRTDMPSMQTARWGPASVAIGGRMMIFGGTDPHDQILASCESFDPTTNEWSALPPMSTPRACAFAAVWQDCAFVFGGYSDGVGPLSSAERFDPMLNRWFHIAPMLNKRWNAAAVAVPDRGIIVMGTTLISADLYDPATNQWTTMSWQLPKPLRSFAAHCIDGVLHIIGGFNYRDGVTSECWSMNLKAAVPVWVPFSSLPFPIHSVASVSV